MSLALFGSIQSASFECRYVHGQFSVQYMSPIYECEVQNFVSITSPDEAQIDNITGTHKAGYNNDNVEHIYVGQGEVHYFPRGLNNFFKNFNGIYIYTTGLKEIHQNDLKDFPKLTGLILFSNNLEILEENLFEFNPKLELIDLSSNQISHIDPNVFDKLTNLNTLYLGGNTCINMEAVRDPTEVQNIINTAKYQCTNSDYSNLEQKVKNFRNELKNLNSADLKIKLDNLKNEIKNSRFSNFFQELNATVIMNDTNSTCNDVNDKLIAQDLKISGFETKLTNISDSVTTINKNNEDLKTKFTNLMIALKNVFNTAN